MNSSATILSSSTTVTQIKMRMENRARRNDDDDVGYDDGSMKGTNRSGLISPFSILQKRKIDRNSSASILPSNATVTLKKKREAKRSRRDDDDDDDDDYSDDDEVEVEEEEAQSGSNRASWTPELVRTCMMCSI